MLSVTCICCSIGSCRFEVHSVHQFMGLCWLIDLNSTLILAGCCCTSPCLASLWSPAVTGRDSSLPRGSWNTPMFGSLSLHFWQRRWKFWLTTTTTRHTAPTRRRWCTTTTTAAAAATTATTLLRLERGTEEGRNSWITTQPAASSTFRTDLSPPSSSTTTIIFITTGKLHIKTETRTPNCRTPLPRLPRRHPGKDMFYTLMAAYIQERPLWSMPGCMERLIQIRFLCMLHTLEWNGISMEQDSLGFGIGRRLLKKWEMRWIFWCRTWSCVSSSSYLTLSYVLTMSASSPSSLPTWVQCVYELHCCCCCCCCWVCVGEYVFLFEHMGLLLSMQVFTCACCNLYVCIWVSVCGRVCLAIERKHKNEEISVSHCVQLFSSGRLHSPKLLPN